MKIALVTDSTCNITPQEAEKLGIHLVYLTVSFKNESIQDGEMTLEEIFQRMDDEGVLATTSQPATGDFLDTYESLAKDYDQILSIHLGGQFSGTYSSAQSAAKMVEGVDIRIFDTGTASILAGNMVLRAKEMIDEGKTMDEIFEELGYIRDQTIGYGALETTENLVKGGRLPALAGRVVKSIDIKPVLSLHNNKLAIEKISRSKKKAISRAIDLTVQAAEKIDRPYKIAVLGAVNEEEVQRVKQMLEEDYFPNQEINTYEFSPVVSVHAGPGVVFIALLPQ